MPCRALEAFGLKRPHEFQRCDPGFVLMPCRALEAFGRKQVQL